MGIIPNHEDPPLPPELYNEWEDQDTSDEYEDSQNEDIESYLRGEY